MLQNISLVTILVRDYDEAIRHYCDVLGFTLVEDTPLTNGKRWVRVAPPNSIGMALLIARAVGPEQQSRIGNQTGGRVFLFLHTNDIAENVSRLKSRGVRFTREPQKEAYGTVAVFEDLYGNRIDLIEPSSQATPDGATNYC